MRQESRPASSVVVTHIILGVHVKLSLLATYGMRYNGPLLYIEARGAIFRENLAFFAARYCAARQRVRKTFGRMILIG